MSKLLLGGGGMSTSQRWSVLMLLACLLDRLGLGLGYVMYVLAIDF